MDAQQDPTSTSTTTTQVPKPKPLVIPGPKRLAFRIRRRGFSFTGSPSLMISNRHGVWSLGHRRYIRKTRYHRRCTLAEQLGPVEAAYHSLLRRGMSRWLQYDDRAREEITFWKHRLMDIYWSVATDARRAAIIQFFRDQARARRATLFGNVAVLAGALALWLHVEARILEQFSAYPAWVILSFTLANVCLLGVAVRWVLAGDQNKSTEYMYIAKRNDVP